jgi:hypothetical protein
MKERKTIAYKRHADYYMDLLMDEEKTPEELFIELGQIQLAFHRIQQEEVGSNFHPSQLEVRLREISGGHANVFLPKLLNGTATEKEIKDIEVALTSIATKEVDYPVTLETLTNRFKELYNRAPQFSVKIDSNKNE